MCLMMRVFISERLLPHVLWLDGQLQHAPGVPASSQHSGQGLCFLLTVLIGEHAIPHHLARTGLF